MVLASPRRSVREKMTRSTILLPIACLLAAVTFSAVAAKYTDAAFKDNQSPANNNLSSGTIVLQTNSAYGVTATLNSTSMKPNTALTGTTINLKNAGTLNGSNVGITFSYSLNAGSLTADQVASVLQVTTLTYDTANLLTGVGAPNGALADTNGNTYIDLQDLTNATNVAKLAGLAGLTAGQSKAFNITLTARPYNSGSGFVSGYVTDACQGCGINITMTFTLNQ